jgi:hypothetical protein
VRADGHKTQVENLPVENKPVKNKVQKDVECRVGASGNAVPEYFGRDKPQAGKMKKIHNPDNHNPAKM